MYLHLIYISCCKEAKCLIEGAPTHTPRGPQIYSQTRQYMGVWYLLYNHRRVSPNTRASSLWASRYICRLLPSASNSAASQAVQLLRAKKGKGGQGWAGQARAAAAACERKICTIRRVCNSIHTISSSFPVCFCLLGLQSFFWIEHFYLLNLWSKSVEIVSLSAALHTLSSPQSRLLTTDCPDSESPTTGITTFETIQPFPSGPSQTHRYKQSVANESKPRPLFNFLRRAIASGAHSIFWALVPTATPFREHRFDWSPSRAEDCDQACRTCVCVGFKRTLQSYQCQRRCKYGVGRQVCAFGVRTFLRSMWESRGIDRLTLW